MVKPLTAPVTGSREFKQLEPGSYIAVCNLVCYVGLQPGSQQYPAPKLKVHLRFEVPSERIEYEREGEMVEGPQTIGETLTFSMNKKATLRHQLEGWRGCGFTDEEAAVFDISALLGKACMLSVTQMPGADGKVRSRIQSIGKLPKGMPAPNIENPLIYYSVDDPDPEAFSRLPKWLQQKCSERLRQPESDADPDDEIPF